MLFTRLLPRLVRVGRLTVVDADGRRHTYQGAALDTLPNVTIRLHDRALHHRLALFPTLKVGEAYMDGTLTVEEGSLYDFLSLSLENLRRAGNKSYVTALESLTRVVRRLQQLNPADRARRNVAHHYDLSGALYDLFLDADRQYSCAYFTHPGQDLESAQDAKKRHIAAKLLLEPGQKVLDIGCGWGGLALSLAREADVEVTGITLSTEQLAVARERAKNSQFAEKVRFDLRDYRHQAGTFDRIVSVGMFEHVGVNHYGQFFRKVRDLLTEEGVGLLHSIGRPDGPGATNAWIRKYIFPGGYCPALSEVLAAVERAGLFVTDVEILRLHYADTLREWARRFQANRDKAAQLYDERFCRMWEFYLAGCEATFRHQGMMVFQMQIARRHDTVPVTRTYIDAWEKAHALA
ncbi:MAG: class I SAM-dependent methyltransferase [Rhodospirillales bacterium]|nr:class I SAM-dependent methyltransferase [Rhodospirillales bacterium]